jgi:hypothetical protein
MWTQFVARGEEQIGDAGTKSRSHRRVVLLTGAARSGTTWLATILNTYKGVIYCHEPFYKPNGERMASLVEKMKTSILDESDRAALIHELCKSHPEWRRPPFFPKDCTNWPAALQLACWHLARLAPRAEGTFCRLFSPDPRSSYDLLIKDVDWGLHINTIVDSLECHVIHIIRHPCAVISSVLRGQRLGLMPANDRHSWLLTNEHVCRPLGYGPASVLAMDDHEFLALSWLVENYLTQRQLERQPGTTVVYEELCRIPVDVAEALFRHLGWPMGPRTRTFIELSTGIRHSLLADLQRATNRYFGVFRDRTKVLDSWKAELSDQVIKGIVSVAGQLPGYRDHWPE